MKLFKNNQQYNLVTLNPKAKEDKKQFWSFRAEDVTEMFSFYFAFGILIWILFILRIFAEDEDAQLQKFIIYSVILFLKFIVWLLVKRLKKNATYLIPFVYFCQLVLFFVVL